MKIFLVILLVLFLSGCSTTDNLRTKNFNYTCLYNQALSFCESEYNSQVSEFTNDEFRHAFKCSNMMGLFQGYVSLSNEEINLCRGVVE